MKHRRKKLVVACLCLAIVATAAITAIAEQHEYSVVAKVLNGQPDISVHSLYYSNFYGNVKQGMCRDWHFIGNVWNKMARSIYIQWEWPSGEIAKYYLTVPGWPWVVDWYSAQDTINLRFVVTEQGEYDDCKIYLPFAAEELGYVQFYYYNYGWPGEAVTEELVAVTEEQTPVASKEAAKSPIGGMIMLTLIVGVSLGIVVCVGLGLFKGGYRLVPRKGGGFIGEHVPFFSVKISRNNLDDEKE